jgi:hypothetical protein
VLALDVFARTRLSLAPARGGAVGCVIGPIAIDVVVALTAYPHPDRRRASRNYEAMRRTITSL